jgi:hypothetical protein
MDANDAQRRRSFLDHLEGPLLRRAKILAGDPTSPTQAAFATGLTAVERENLAVLAESRIGVIMEILIARKDAEIENFAR